MLERVKRYIISEHLLPLDGGRVLVAISGGSDSVALLDILLRLGYDCYAVHCNFHLRGAESDRDEAFVRSLCNQWKVSLHVRHFDTTDYAQKQHISIEMAARDLRYALFEQLLTELDCCAIAVGHHANDQAETLLLHLQRGTGIRGLQGMHAVNGHIVRPLLCVTRTDIDAYLTIRHLSHVDDSTNSDTTFQRNAIRALLQHFSPADIEHMATTCRHMQQYALIIEDYIATQRCLLTEQIGDELHINIALLQQTPSPTAVLYELLRPYGFRQTDDILDSLTARSGKRFYAEQYVALKDRDLLIVSPIALCENAMPNITYTIRKRLPHETYPPTDAMSIIVDAHAVKQPLHLRHWQVGDRFYPLGMKQQKKVQDFFSDLKLPLTTKEKVWLLCSGNDIVWIVGYRIDNRYRVTPETRHVAEISINQ